MATATRPKRAFVAYMVYPYLSAAAWASLTARARDCGCSTGIAGLDAEGRAITSRETPAGRVMDLVPTTREERVALTTPNNRPEF
jgi:hypothetical protein